MPTNGYYQIEIIIWNHIIISIWLEYMKPYKWVQETTTQRCKYEYTMKLIP